ncbi:MAG: TetR/AcrR family fatty acid metabolism transcriptional regulator [Glaciecola sp.]|jgi:TetR/AcrR family fatty acid metabolism transcriptional regulator
MAPTRGQRTRAAVLSAARARFAAEGFEGSALSRIAADVGVSEPTVAFHFGNKAGLLVAVIEDYYDDLLLALDEAVDPALAPEQRLRSFAHWWLVHNEENLALLSVFGRQGRRIEVDEVVTAFVSANRRVTRVFDRLIEDLGHVGGTRADVSVRIFRDAFFGTAEHLMLGRATTGRPERLDQAADELVDLLLHGAAAVGDIGATTTSEPTDLATIDRKLEQILDRLA